MFVLSLAIILTLLLTKKDYAMSEQKNIIVYNACIGIEDSKLRPIVEALPRYFKGNFIYYKDLVLGTPTHKLLYLQFGLFDRKVVYVCNADNKPLLTYDLKKQKVIAYAKRS